MNMVEGSTTPGPHGPQVIPGVYTLKLTVDGQVYTSNVTVVNDPRVGQSPALMAALRTQNKLTLLSVQGMEQSFAGHEEVECRQEPACDPDAGQPARRCRRAGQDARCQSDQNWRRACRPAAEAAAAAAVGPCGCRSQRAAILLRH